MITEPQYEYVKGEGWVLTDHKTIMAVDRDGIKCLLINRKPEVDERFYYGYMDENFYRNVDHVSNYSCHHSFLTGDQYDGKSTDTIVVVPCD